MSPASSRAGWYRTVSRWNTEKRSLASGPFKKILIANRGEIALRVICACKDLGIPTVAVYSEADRHSLPVRFADQAICIGPAKSARSYLDIPSIISAAEIAQVDAIHPGYGFLSENAGFAEVCRVSGIKFIGPKPDVISAMGLKERARAIMKDYGVPILPGSEGVLESEEEALEVAGKIGYPVILKASAGGGGRGMRIVHKPEELAANLAQAKAEAGAAFSSADVYLEKYIGAPRHIEFQVLADEHGNVEILGERDCSIQRRHQKLLEESPSPALRPEVRERVMAKLKDAIKAIGYSNAGTIEFLMDEKGDLYFVEAKCPHPGRAPGNGDGDRDRPGQGTVPHRGGRKAERISSADRSGSAAMPSNAGSTLRIRRLLRLRPVGSPG